ncbi:MAG: methyltransferase [Actinomycetia bacterium]|nr:methyltransferase [Actinomycetes bacterium]
MRVELPTIDCELVSSLLWQLNTTGIATLDGHPDPLADPLPSSTEPHSYLLAGFETEPEAQRAAGTIGSAPRGTDVVPWTISIETVDQAAWVDPNELAGVSVAGVELSIEVGGAFGHGQHPTTRLILDLLADHSPRPDEVLDFGCGTGVLALAALAVGASVVCAVDNDPSALDMTRRNLERNRDRLDTSGVEVVGALGEWECGGGRASFDAVLVNVLLPVHQQWGARLASVLAPGGVIMVSGVLHDQRSAVLAAYPSLRISEERLDGDWLGLVLR